MRLVHRLCFPGVAIVAQLIGQHSFSASVLRLTMKRPAIFQDTDRATRCRTTAIDPTKEAPMAVCPDAAESAHVVTLSYSALVALASEGGCMDVTLMPRLPPVRGLDPNDGAIFCEDCSMWLNGALLYSEHLTGKKHRSSMKKKAACGPCIPPAPFPL